MNTFPPPAPTGAAQPHPADAESATHKAGQALRRELADLKSDLDALMSHEATLSDGELSEAYARILARLGASGTVAKIAAHDTGPKLPSAGYEAACAYVRGQPMESLVAASLAGMLAGWLTKPH